MKNQVRMQFCKNTCAASELFIKVLTLKLSNSPVFVRPAAGMEIEHSSQTFLITVKRKRHSSVRENNRAPSHTESNYSNADLQHGLSSGTHSNTRLCYTARRKKKERE
jgi:hypothetical protein